jgi:lysyl-tRNA synthetase class 2
MLEWYRAHADYTDIMRDCENLLLAIYRATRDPDEDPAAPPILHYQGMEVDLTPPWERITVREALARYAGVDLGAVMAWDALAAVATAKGYPVPPGTTWDEMLGQIFANEVESHLGVGHPTILYDYPVAWAGLSRTRPDDPQTAERFEFYIANVELGNAFSELTDAAEQADRLRADQAARAVMGKKAFAVDHDFLAALAAGMPPAGGIAVGVDRLVMLFADVPSIHDTLWMPGREFFGPQATVAAEED